MKLLNRIKLALDALRSSTYSEQGKSEVGDAPRRDDAFRFGAGLKTFGAAVGVVVALLAPFSPVVFAQATPVVPKCDGTFLDLPSWHKYLPKDAATCEIKLDFYDPNKPADSSVNKLWLIAAAIIEILMRIGGLIAIIWIIRAGFQMTMSNGDPGAVKELRQRLIYTGVGLCIIILAQAIVGFVAGKIDSTSTISNGSVDFLVPQVGADTLVAQVIKDAFGILGAISVLMVVIGGIKMITSQGNPADFKKARDTIIYAIAGVVVALSAYGIVGLIVSKI
jgi:Type IV secretion system pilin